MSSESDTQLETTASSTLYLLESRLNRLTYLLTGDTAWTGTPNPPPKPSSYDETVSRRLQRLESELESLAGKVGVVRDVLGLYERFPDLFRSTSTTSLPTSTTEQRDTPETTQPSDPETEPSPPLQIMLSIILSYASLISETASRLTSLTDTPIPDTSLSASLIALQPRMNQLAAKQDEQSREIAELRVRTAKVLQRYYEVSLLGGGEVWGEWEGRMERVEREVRRVEVARGREGI
ncbi:putative nuclear distribution protein RO10 [Aspergillus foveolatus]|uniref:putative nuclear distribution protein RO10 n=1 Tax=Aspergillus foveolatus TaxID=210207 RepID=UPI003CCC95AA